MLALALCLQAALPPVEINHCFLVLDPQTMKAIKASTFISKEFCTAYAEHVTSGKESWDGYYLEGRSTYIEFLTPSPELTPGDGGIGLSVERIGDSAPIYERMLMADSADARSDLQVWTAKDGHSEPWFRSFAFRDSERLSVWLMDFRPESYRAEKIAIPKDGKVPRNSLMPPAKMFGDIVAIDACGTPNDLLAGARTLRCFGFRQKASWSGDSFTGPALTVRLSARTVGQFQTVRHLRLSLAKAPGAKQEFRLGKSTLTLHTDGFADWVFA